MADDVKPWPSNIARLIGDLVETRTGSRGVSMQTEGGPPISRPTGPAFPVLRGRATLSTSELAALNSTRLGRFEVEWKGQRKLVRLAPDSVSPGNPRELSNQSEYVGNASPRTTYTIEFDLLLLTPPSGGQE